MVQGDQNTWLTYSNIKYTVVLQGNLIVYLCIIENTDRMTSIKLIKCGFGCPLITSCLHQFLWKLVWIDSAVEMDGQTDGQSQTVTHIHTLAMVTSEVYFFHF
jgi:hypothetical protein